MARASQLPAFGAVVFLPSLDHEQAPPFTVLDNPKSEIVRVVIGESVRKPNIPEEEKIDLMRKNFSQFGMMARQNVVV